MVKRFGVASADAKSKMARKLMTRTESLFTDVAGACCGEILIER